MWIQNLMGQTDQLFFYRSKTSFTNEKLIITCITLGETLDQLTSSSKLTLSLCYRRWKQQSLFHVTASSASFSRSSLFGSNKVYVVDTHFHSDRTYVVNTFFALTEPTWLTSFLLWQGIRGWHFFTLTEPTWLAPFLLWQDLLVDTAFTLTGPTWLTSFWFWQDLLGW